MRRMMPRVCIFCGEKLLAIMRDWNKDGTVTIQMYHQKRPFVNYRKPACKRTMKEKEAQEKGLVG